MPVVENSENPACKVVGTLRVPGSAHGVFGLQGTDEDEIGKVANLPAEKSWRPTGRQLGRQLSLGKIESYVRKSSWRPTGRHLPAEKLPANWPAIDVEDKRHHGESCGGVFLLPGLETCG